MFRLILRLRHAIGILWEGSPVSKLLRLEAPLTASLPVRLHIDLQFVDVEKQLFEGLNPGDCFLDGKQALGQLLMNHKSNAGCVDSYG